MQVTCVYWYTSYTSHCNLILFLCYIIEPASNDVMNHMLCQKPSNSRESRGELFEPMHNKTYELLSKFYAPFNHNLSLLLQNEDYRWHNE